MLKKKALVVDDNGNNLLLEKDLLEVAGFEVFEAENASRGIAIARKEKPDIIIMDMRLPDMRGSEAARQHEMVWCPLLKSDPMHLGIEYNESKIMVPYLNFSPNPRQQLAKEERGQLGTS